MQQKNLYLYCNIALLMAALISGLSFVAQKLGMLYVGPFTFNTLRCFIGALCIVPMLFIFRDNRRKYSRKNLIFGGILAGIILFFAFSINQYCMIYAKAGIAGFITSLYILFVPIIAVFLKQKLRLNVKISILISVIGLYLLCAENVTSLAKWDMLLLVSAFFFALHIVTVSFYSKKANAIKLSFSAPFRPVRFRLGHKSQTRPMVASLDIPAAPAYPCPHAVYVCYPVIILPPSALRAGIIFIHHRHSQTSSSSALIHACISQAKHITPYISVHSARWHSLHGGVAIS